MDVPSNPRSMNRVVATSSNRASRRTASSRVGRPPRRAERSAASVPASVIDKFSLLAAETQYINDTVWFGYWLAINAVREPNCRLRRLADAFGRQESGTLGFPMWQPAWESSPSPDVAIRRRFGEPPLQIERRNAAAGPRDSSRSPGRPSAAAACRSFFDGRAATVDASNARSLRSLHWVASHTT